VAGEFEGLLKTLARGDLAPVYLLAGDEPLQLQEAGDALRAGKVDVLDAPAKGVATLSVPVAAFGSRLLTSGAVQRVGEYVVSFDVQFTLTDGNGNTVIPMQSLSLSHEFAIDQTQFSAISSETEAIQRSLVREMTDAVMRRLEAQAHLGMPAAASRAGVPSSAACVAVPAPASSAD
jgi:LPS-assembly lipoprotein